MAMADFDGDGDLDIVVNNLMTPAQLFENRLCDGASLLVDLRMPGSANAAAIGAELTLITNVGAFHRDVRATAGYLSGATSQVHFGFPVDAVLERLEVRWPDGAVSVIESAGAASLAYPPPMNGLQLCIRYGLPLFRGVRRCLT